VFGSARDFGQKHRPDRAEDKVYNPKRDVQQPSVKDNGAEIVNGERSNNPKDDSDYEKCTALIHQIFLYCSSCYIRSGRYSDGQVTKPTPHSTDTSATRDAYTEALADYVLAFGIAGSSLRPMAKAAGTSDRMLVYHFGSKAGVMETALTRIVERNSAALDAALPPSPLPAEQLMPMIGMAMAGPLFDQSIAVFLELASLAQRGEPTAKAMGFRIASHFHDWLAARLTEPERAGELLCAVEGWALLTAVGLDVAFPSG
jgi:AcrR family transcriptional regulator